MKSCFLEILKYRCLVFYIVWLKASNHGFLKTVLLALFENYLIIVDIKCL